MPSAISIETAQRIAAAWNVAGSVSEAMEMAGIRTKDARNQNKYRRMAEQALGITLPTINAKNATLNWPTESVRYDRDKEYTAVIFSDGHFWPNTTSSAYWVMLEIVKRLKPQVIIDNGDSLDGATISRHAPNMWEHPPSLAEEYEAVKWHLGEIKKAAPKAAFFRNVGNHDSRIEARLAQNVPEFKDMPGLTVGEMFPDWDHQLSVVLNDCCIVKHRWHGGIHAAFNNTLKGGVNIVTGHTHRLHIREWTDYRGTRYGIETGTLAEPYGPQFRYCEDQARNWQPGFIVLTVIGDRIYPEKVQVEDGKAFFRGEWITDGIRRPGRQKRLGA